MLDIRGVHHDIDPAWRRTKNSGLNTLALVTQGKLVYTINGQKLDLQKGDILFIPHMLEREGFSLPDEPHRKYTVVFAPPTDSRLPLCDRTDFLHIRPANTPYLEQRFSIMLEQWLEKKTYYRELTSYILCELLTLIAQLREEYPFPTGKELMVRRMQDYIVRHYQRNIPIKELAELIGRTPNYATILFQEVLSTTPVQYMHQIRINAAVDLLHNTQMTIEEISEYLGYCNPSYFNRVFRKWMGVPPSRMRGEPDGGLP